MSGSTGRRIRTSLGGTVLRGRRRARVFGVQGVPGHPPQQPAARALDDHRGVVTACCRDERDCARRFKEWATTGPVQPSSGRVRQQCGISRNATSRVPARNSGSHARAVRIRGRGRCPDERHRVPCNGVAPIVALASGGRSCLSSTLGVRLAAGHAIAARSSLQACAHARQASAQTLQCSWWPACCSHSSPQDSHAWAQAWSWAWVRLAS